MKKSVLFSFLAFSIGCSVGHGGKTMEWIKEQSGLRNDPKTRRLFVDGVVNTAKFDYETACFDEQFFLGALEIGLIPLKPSQQDTTFDQWIMEQAKAVAMDAPKNQQEAEEKCASLQEKLQTLDWQLHLSYNFQELQAHLTYKKQLHGAKHAMLEDLYGKKEGKGPGMVAPAVMKANKKESKDPQERIAYYQNLLDMLPDEIPNPSAKNIKAFKEAHGTQLTADKSIDYITDKGGIYPMHLDIQRRKDTFYCIVDDLLKVEGISRDLTLFSKEITNQLRADFQSHVDKWQGRLDAQAQEKKAE